MGKADGGGWPDNADTVVRQDLVRGTFFQSWGHIKSPSADIKPSPSFLVKVTHKEKQSFHFPIDRETSVPEFPSANHAFPYVELHNLSENSGCFK